MNRYYVISAFRASFRRRALEQAYLQALAMQPEAHAVSLEEKLLMVEALHAVDAMLEGLGRKVIQAFLLLQLQGIAYKEIATRLSVSVSSVTRYVAKASHGIRTRSTSAASGHWQPSPPQTPLLSHARSRSQRQRRAIVGLLTP